MSLLIEPAVDNLPLYNYGTLRPYFIEPLLIAQDALKTYRCPTNVIGSTAPGPGIIRFGPRDKIVLLQHSDVGYGHCNLTYDWSVPGATRSELRQSLSDQIDELNRQQWDSWDIELVSRKLNYGQKKRRPRGNQPLPFSAKRQLITSLESR